MKLPDKPMAQQSFAALRAELLKTSTQLSCHQLLDLADLFHTVIRLRKPHRPLKNVHELFCEAPSWSQLEGDRAPSTTCHDIAGEPENIVKLNVNHNL